MSSNPDATARKIRIRAAVNGWVSEHFPEHRRFLVHAAPEYSLADQAWAVELATKHVNGHSVALGCVLVDDDANVVHGLPEAVHDRLLGLLVASEQPSTAITQCMGDGYDFRLGDGIAGAAELPDKSVDLLLTDPPYGISNPYTCEGQVPRRLRRDGTDFIMPRGDFGEWDDVLKPDEWMGHVLSKVRGWAVTFCAQAQIGDYCAVLKAHRFVAVGTFVWQKTNPVPFNHKFKPINAWEAMVIGKRPGTAFNGKVVHNVLCYKSPSPQQRIHTTQKPLPLIERLIELFSSGGNMVLDPYAGSATTVIAARRLGRTVLAYEKDANTYQAACQRLMATIL